LGDVKLRYFAAVGACAVAALGLTGCDSKVGTAAEVNGSKISESSLSGYLTPKAQALQGSDGTSSVAPRTVVLQYLIRNKIFESILAKHGTPATDQALDSTKSAVLQGGSEDQLVQQITGVGLSKTFEPVVLRNQELIKYIGTKFSEADANAALANAKASVVVNPRYGTWNNQTLEISDLSKKQLPSFLTYDGNLPGDPAPSS
jgi:hypothetical protein